VLPCRECGEGIRSPLKEEQIVMHIAALLEDIDVSTAKRFLTVFTMPKTLVKNSYELDMADVPICPHCASMEYVDWLSTYELPLQFWMGLMALPSIAQPFVLQVRQFADARLFPVVHKTAMQKIEGKEEPLADSQYAKHVEGFS